MHGFCINNLINGGTYDFKCKTHYVCVILDFLFYHDCACFLGDYAFASNHNIKSIILPDSVTYIGEGAFNFCEYLEEITVPDTITYVGYSAFFATTWYNNLPDGLIYLGKVAYNYKGYTPETLNIIIKDGTKSIAPYAFEEQPNVNIVIPKSVENFGRNTFIGVDNLVLYVYEHSKALDFAEKNYFPYKVIGDPDPSISFDDKYIYGIPCEQTLDNIIELLGTIVTVKDSEGNILSDDSIVSTGCVINYMGKDYTVIIKGDVYADGVIEALDYLCTKRAFLGTYTLSEVRLKAACIDDNDTLTPKDYCKIKRAFLGTYNLYE